MGPSVARVRCELFDDESEVQLVFDRQLVDGPAEADRDLSVGLHAEAVPRAMSSTEVI